MAVGAEPDRIKKASAWKMEEREFLLAHCQDCAAYRCHVSAHRSCSTSAHGRRTPHRFGLGAAVIFHQLQSGRHG